ncbi:unnamed protein product [Prorocentrum cordatum]|uniref:Uncharacterized protein n=1 Tax=Prorocentrum cordatum TaxID=2364126 RepID=A0ABN9UGJ2_9DINO|nr:unnamed protein product [Polarella glacialis]
MKAGTKGWRKTREGPTRQRGSSRRKVARGKGQKTTTKVTGDRCRPRERRSEESRQCSTQNEHPAQASWEKEQQRKTTHWLPQRGRHSAEAGASPGTSTAGLCRDIAP